MELIQRAHPRRDFHDPQLVTQNQIPFSSFRLAFQRANLHFQFFNFIPNTNQILFRFLQLSLRLFLAVAVAGNSGRLLKNLPAVRAAGGDDFCNPSLADYGISVPAEPRVHEEAVDILQANRLAIDRILTLTAAIVAARQHNLRLIRVKNAGGVIQDKRNLRKTQGTSLFRPPKNHVLHPGAPQRATALFAHDPEDRIGDVGLARTVGANDRRYLFFKRETGLVGK